MTRRARIAGRAACEDGFTLVELLVCLVLGVVLLSATLYLVEVSLHVTSRMTDRVDSAQLGRTAMEKITQELHSSCVAAAVTPIQAGSDGTHLSFVSAYSSLPVVTPTLHQISYSSATLTDSSYAVTGGVAPAWTFATAPTKAVKLLTNVSQITAGSPAVARPVFQYFAFVNGALSTTPLPVPLSAANAALAAQVAVGFVAGPSSGNLTADRATAYSDSVVLRLSPAASDPTVTNSPCS